MILSVDGRGSVSLHFPALPDGSTRLVVGGDQELRHSFELDDAPHFERFFFLTSTSPMDVKAAKRAINALGDKADKVRPRLPAGVVLQYELLLRKGRPRTGTP